MYRKLEHNNPQLSQHKYSNETLEGLEIDLKEEGAVHLFQNCDIKECYIRVNSSSTSTPNILSGNRWSNCIFHPNKELSLSTIEADFYHCTFKGKWSGRIKGEVEGCDFSGASLINFAFYNIQSAGANTFPGANTVLIEHAGSHLDELKAALSGKSRLCLHIRPEVGLFVFDIAKHKDSKVLREVLPGLPYVKYALC